MGKAKDQLEPRQERFCQEYLKDLNATKAAIRASYSEKTARQLGSQLLANVNIQARVQELMEKRAKRNEVCADRVLREIQRLGYSDIRVIYDEKGCIRDPKEWPEAIARAVRSIEAFEEFEYVQSGFHCEQCGRKANKALIGQTKKISFWDKPKSLELLAKHKSLLTEKVEHSAIGSLAEILAGTWKKEGDQ